MGFTVFTESPTDHTQVRVIARGLDYGVARQLARQHAATVAFDDNPRVSRVKMPPAPLRRIIDRGDGEVPYETLECGHLHRAKQHPYYPERHLEAKSRRCLKCRDEQLNGPWTTATR